MTTSPAPADGTVDATHFGFRHASRKKPALQHLSFHIPPGQRVLLLGPSGAGKSTLLSAIAGVLDADDGDTQGTLQTHGVVGMVLQDPDSQVIASTVGDDVAFGCENRNIPREEIWPRVEEALQSVGLHLSLTHPTTALSGGQKQRMALAGVLAMGADIVLLDEPTANLDPQGVTEVVQAVQQVHAENNPTVIIVEHRVATWIDQVDAIMVLSNSGELLAYDTPEKILKEHGQQLAQQGVWIPGIDPELPPAIPLDNTDSAAPALGTHELIVGWEKPTRASKTIAKKGVLEVADLSFYQGASTVILGPNGVGKSTLLLTLAGLLEPIAGTVETHPAIAEGLDSNPARWKSRELAQRMGYVFQDPEHQFVAKTVREELLAGIRKPTQRHQERADEILERLQLTHLAQANPFSLSGGQKRRLSVATALVESPKVVFLDEPTFGQDRKTFTELVTLLQELRNSGTTIISITHDELYRKALGDVEVHL